MIFIQGYIVAIVSILAVIVFILMEIKLSKMDSPWKGLIPIGIAIFFMAVLIVVTMVTVGRQNIDTLKADLNNGMHAEMTVRRIGDQLLGYGPIEIYDETGVLRDVESIYMGDFDDRYSSLPRYGDLFEEMTQTYEIIPTNPCDGEKIKDKSVLVIPDGGTNTYLNWSVIWVYMLFMLAPMGIIYWLRRKELNQERIKKELQKMSIDSL